MSYAYYVYLVGNSIFSTYAVGKHHGCRKKGGGEEITNIIKNYPRTKSYTYISIYIYIIFGMRTCGSFI